MKYKRLIVSLVVTQLPGIVGSLFTIKAIPEWYTTLEKPIFNPPGWVFGPVWTVLYILMGISIYLIWEELHKGKHVKNIMILFWIHLFFNATWSIVFFGLQNIGLAFFNIFIIWSFIMFLMISFYTINKKAACLLIPYFIWVSFALILNFSIWLLN